MHEFEYQPRLCPFQVDWGILQETCISLRDPLHGALQNYGYIYIYMYIYICIHIGVIQGLVCRVSRNYRDFWRSSLEGL